MVVLRVMSVVMTPPSVSTPSERGVTSNRTISLTSPDNTPAGSAGTAIPGCSVADDFNNQLGDPAEGRLSVALAYRDGAACPSPTGYAPPGTLGKASAPRAATEVYVPKSVWRTNRILRR